MGLVEFSVDSTLILYDVQEWLVLETHLQPCCGIPGGLSEIRIRERGAGIQTGRRVDEGRVVQAVLVDPVVGRWLVEVFHWRVLPRTGKCSVAGWHQ